MQWAAREHTPGRFLGRQGRIGLAVVLAIVWMQPLLSGEHRGVASAQAQSSMTPNEWQDMTRRVASTLDQIGMQMGVAPQVRALYVPRLTQEYLRVFQGALLQGMPPQQADILASHYVVGLIRQAMAGSGSTPGDAYPGQMHRGAFGTWGSDGKCSYVNTPHGSVMTGQCN